MSETMTTTTAVDQLTSDFPDSVKEFARELAELCKKHNLSEFTGNYRPGWRSNIFTEVHFAWDSGRHGEESDVIHLRMNKLLNLGIAIAKSGGAK